MDNGKISIGGTDIRDYTLESLMNQMSMVFQSVYLFQDTIENNIRFGKPKASREEVIVAAKKACCHEFIMSLPGNYDTVFGEKGFALSGGEKQRISIARAILKDAPIIIFDEATANVDPENEDHLQKAIEELTKDKTIIMIAHRLKTVRHADQILVVDDGHIVQKGRHEELITEEGILDDILRRYTMMTHKFDINNKSKLDNPKRREMLPVNKVLTEIGLNAEDGFADIGCEIGYFSIPAAEVVGTKGVVYALDVKEEMIEVLDEKIEENNLYNIRAIITDEYDFKLVEKSVSYAFMCTVLHEIEDRIKFLNETKRILIDGGRIAVVEWIKRVSDWEPPVNHRLESNDVKPELQNCGFKDHTYVELNEYFYIVIATL